MSEDLEEDVEDVAVTDGDSKVIRIVLADSQAIYRVGMRKVFALEDDMRVVAQAETLENLYAAIQRFPTDIVVMEGHLIAGTE
jgi:DNA-binding NarL/FixJ family response regulator